MERFYLKIEVDNISEFEIFTYSEILQEIEESFEDVQSEIIRRDDFDSNRKESPLKKAEDAVEIDTSFMNIDEVVGAISELIKEKK